MIEGLLAALLEKLLVYFFKKGKVAVVMALLSNKAHNIVEKEVSAHVEASAKLVENPNEYTKDALIRTADKLLSMPARR